MKRIKPQEIKTLDGLTLLEQKLLALHFSPKRKDCVRLNYEYDVDIDRAFLAEAVPISLTSEIQELDWFDLAKEYGLQIPDYKKYVMDKLAEHIK